MIDQTRRGLAPIKAQRRLSVLIPSLWVINAVLVGVVILAPASKQASTSPVDDMTGIVESKQGCVSQSCPKQLVEYLGQSIRDMRETDSFVSVAPEGVSEVHALRSPSRAVAHLEGDSSGGKLVIRLDEGSYRGQWVDPVTQRVVSEPVMVQGGTAELICPAFSGAITLDIKRTS